MDVKLGQAFKANTLGQHVQMGVKVAEDFVKRFDLSAKDSAAIIEAVAAHHGTAKFASVEAEIVANADCYRFIHPVGVFHYIGNLVKRGLDHNAVIAGAEAKLAEKVKILSLDCCKRELLPFASQFKALFAAVRV